MANRTDISTIKIFGSNPQYLISNIIRNKIYDSVFWKEKCFALTAESIIDLAISLKYVGGTYGGNRKPTPFLCLVLKLLQIQPDKEIIYEYIKNEEFIYLRALGCFYLRLVGKSVDVYKHLEPVLTDYRKIRIRLTDGKFEKMYMDEFVDNCLVLNNFLDVDFPSLTKRQIIEENQLLQKRTSVCYQEFLKCMEKERDMEKEKNSETKRENKRQEEKEKGKEKKKEKYINRSTSISSYSDRFKKEKKWKKEKEKIKKKEKRSDEAKKNDWYKKRNKYNDHYKKRDRKKRRSQSIEKSVRRKRKRRSKERRERKSLSSYSSDHKSYEKEKNRNRKHKKCDNPNYKESLQNNSNFEDKKKDKYSIDEWNKIREKLGMKPLK